MELQRYSMMRDPARLDEDWQGQWVQHSDAAAQLAAKEAEIERLEGDLLKFNNIGYELRVRAEKAEQERDDARARVDAQEADAIKAMHEAGVLRRFKYNQIGHVGEIDAVVRSPFMSILAEWLAADFKANGGINYVEQELKLMLTDRTEEQMYTVLVQKAGAKTPAQVASELRTERDNIRRRLALAVAEVNKWRSFSEDAEDSSWSEAWPSWCGRLMPVQDAVNADPVLRAMIGGGE